MTSQWSTRQLVAADLRAATGRQGLRATLSAAVFEPGFGTVLLHRLSRGLAGRGLPRLAKLLWRFNVLCSSCHIHLQASIGPGLKLPHPTGIVVGEGVCIAADVTLYQGVTLGRARHTGAYPIVGDGVTIFPGAVVVGAVTLGPGAVIGASSLVLHDVPAGGVVAGSPARLLRCAES